MASPSPSPSPDPTSVASDVADKIQELGLGTLGTDLFIGSMPDEKDVKNCVCVYDVGGINPTRFYDRSIPEWRNDQFQITTRNRSYAAAMIKAFKISEALDQIGNWDTDYWNYLSLFKLTEPRSIGRQEGTDLQLVTHEWDSRRNKIGE